MDLVFLQWFLYKIRLFICIIEPSTPKSITELKFGGGNKHDNWNINLKFAVKIQEKANEMYPGLFKPIILRNSRYNQQLAKGSCIIEVGATGNTLEQSLTSMKYLSKVLSEM